MGSINLSHINIGTLAAVSAQERAASGKPAARTDAAVSHLPDVESLVTNAMTTAKLSPAQEKEFYTQLQEKVKELTNTGTNELGESKFKEILNDVAQIAKKTIQEPGQKQTDEAHEKADALKVKEYNSTAVSAQHQVQLRAPRSRDDFDKEVKEKFKVTTNETDRVERGKVLETFLKDVSPEDLRLLKTITQFKMLLSASGGNPENFAKVLSAEHLGVLAEDESLHEGLASVIGKLTPDDKAIQVGAPERDKVLQVLKDKLMAVANHASQTLAQPIGTVAAPLGAASRAKINTIVAASIKSRKDKDIAAKSQGPTAEEVKKAQLAADFKEKAAARAAKAEAAKAKDEEADNARIQKARETIAKQGGQIANTSANSPEEITPDSIHKILGETYPNAVDFRQKLTKLMVVENNPIAAKEDPAAFMAKVEKAKENTKAFMDKLTSTTDLEKFWGMEAEPVGTKGEIDARKEHLKKFLPLLNEQQLKISLERTKVMQLLFGDNAGSTMYAETVAASLTAEQFGIIAANCKKDRLIDLSKLIGKLDPDTKAATGEKLTQLWKNLPESSRNDESLRTAFAMKAQVVLGAKKKGELMKPPPPQG